MVKKHLNNIDIDGIIDSGYIRDYLETKQKSSFPKMISSERPDLTCQNLLNGKIVILVENSPIALILPATLDDFLKSSEDYYQKSINATFIQDLDSMFPKRYLVRQNRGHQHLP